MATTAHGSNGATFLTKFQGVASIGGVLFVMVASIAGLGYTALSERIGKIENNRFTAGEFAQYRERIDGLLARHAGDIRDLDAKIVPRREADAADSFNRSQLALISERLNELRRDAYRSVTVGDELKRLQTDIAELRKQMSNTK